MLPWPCGQQSQGAPLACHQFMLVARITRWLKAVQRKGFVCTQSLGGFAWTAPHMHCTSWQRLSSLLTPARRTRCANILIQATSAQVSVSRVVHEGIPSTKYGFCIERLLLCVSASVPMHSSRELFCYRCAPGRPHWTYVAEKKLQPACVPNSKRGDGQFVRSLDRADACHVGCEANGALSVDRQRFAHESRSMAFSSRLAHMNTSRACRAQVKLSMRMGPSLHAGGRRGLRSGHSDND